MPWTTGDVDGFRKGLDQDGKKTWLKIANSSLASCIKAGKKSTKECEASAIKIANSHFESKKESTIYNAREKSLIIEDVNIQEHYNRINECYPEDVEYGYPYYDPIILYIYGKDIEVNIGMHDFDFRHDMMNVNGLTIPIYNTILPFFEETVSKITINNYLEFLYPNDVIFLFEEVFIVLQKDGIIEFRVPSTEGKNAFGNLNYKSYFNELTFSYLTDRDFPNFSIEKLEVVKEDNDFYFIDGIFKKTRSIF